MFSYSFETDNALTSKVASPDAPTLCMTEDSESDTILYLDDINRAIIINEVKITTETGSTCDKSWSFFNREKNAPS